MFVVYLVAVLAAFAIPSAVGENVLRIRYAAIPLAVLTLSLRRWRPLPVALGVLALAVTWNLTPPLFELPPRRSDPAAHRAYWTPAIGFLRGTSRRRIASRWSTRPATGRPPTWRRRRSRSRAAGYRQDDFPQNEVLYDDPLGSKAYRGWLRGLGVRYVVLTSAPADYSARGEAALLRSGRSGLWRCPRAPRLTIFEVPRPQPILTGPAGGRLVELAATRVLLDLPRAGDYRLAVRFSPYWRAPGACLIRREDGMTTVSATRPGRVQLSFHVGAASALATAVTGGRDRVCNDD